MFSNTATVLSNLIMSATRLCTKTPRINSSNAITRATQVYQTASTTRPHMSSRTHPFQSKHPSTTYATMTPAQSTSRISYTISNQTYTDNDVDSWELKASRRALLNLKTLLGSKQMMALIQPQITEADAYYKKIIAASQGQYREAATHLKASDIKLQQIMHVRQKMNDDMTTDEGREKFFLDVLAKAHPEHYALPPYEDGVVEVIGEHMARLNVDKDSDVPDFVLQYADPSFPAKKAATGRLDDGSVLCYILHQFKDTEEGCELIVRLLFPACAPEVFFREHAEHLAIEFRAGLREAWEMWKSGEVE